MSSFAILQEGSSTNFPKTRKIKNSSEFCSSQSLFSDSAHYRSSKLLINYAKDPIS